MSKAVLISIRPKWCEKIASGEKTVEVRKTRPTLETPFKCYIYCTQGKDARRLRGSWGKVIGEFTCDRITNLFANSRFWMAEDDIIRTCLSADEIRKYANGADEIYGWHISNLCIYDTPRELSDFRRAIDSCDSCRAEYTWECTGCEKWSGDIKRPPQSWCYVE